MKSRTINDAISEVLTIEGHSLSAKEIYSRIIELDLYQFKSTNPYHIVLTQLRRHCIGLDFPTALKEKHYQILPDGTYDLKKTGKLSAKDDSTTKLKVNIQHLKLNHKNT